MNTCPATFIRANYFSTPLTNSKNQLARINVAGHVFINEIHRVVFPHFRVILRTDRPMALCQTLSPAPKKGKGRQRETTGFLCPCRGTEVKVGLKRNFGALTTHFISITANNFFSVRRSPPPPPPPPPNPGLAHVENHGKEQGWEEMIWLTS